MGGREAQAVGVNVEWQAPGEVKHWIKSGIDILKVVVYQSVKHSLKCCLFNPMSVNWFWILPSAGNSERIHEKILKIILLAEFGGLILAPK